MHLSTSARFNVKLIHRDETDAAPASENDGNSSSSGTPLLKISRILGNFEAGRGDITYLYVYWNAVK